MRAEPEPGVRARSLNWYWLVSSERKSSAITPSGVCKAAWLFTWSIKLKMNGEMLYLPNVFVTWSVTRTPFVLRTSSCIHSFPSLSALVKVTYNEAKATVSRNWLRLAVTNVVGVVAPDNALAVTGIWLPLFDRSVERRATRSPEAKAMTWLAFEPALIRSAKSAATDFNVALVGTT